MRSNLNVAEFENRLRDFIKSTSYPFSMCKAYRIFATIVLLIFSLEAVCQKDSRFVSYVAEPSHIEFHWKDDKGQIFGGIQNLKLFLEGKGRQLEFAMNGGMFKPDRSPQGLLVENNVKLNSLDTLTGSGNFYMMPNGVFYITEDNIAVVCKTIDFNDSTQVKFATQSGPMLLIDGAMHPAFKKGSTNLNIRNGVGILPGNKVVFVISREPVNFYDFAEYFEGMKCKNALYLDGFVSRAYIPGENWTQLDGNLGVIISVSK